MVSCTHRPEVARICAHVEDNEYLEAFTGNGIEADLVCRACAESGDRATLSGICAACVESLGEPVGRVGEPGVLRDHRLRLVVETRAIDAPDLAIEPVPGACRDHWLGVTRDGGLFELLDGSARECGRVPVDPEAEHTLHVSRGARFAAITVKRGVLGHVIELATGRTVELVRDDYHAQHCTFPFAFVERDGRVMYIWAPTWNRLDLVDAITGENLSAREFSADDPSHHLDYFHCGLRVSANARRLHDNGWVWHPLGVQSVTSIDAWLANPFETEDGPTRKDLEWRDYWDGPAAWLDDDHVVIWGHGQDREPLDAAEVHSAVTGKRVRWFAGPSWSPFHVDDRHLVTLDSQDLEVWDVDRGVQLAHLTNEHALAAFHPAAKVFASNLANGRQTIARLAGHHALTDARIAAIKARRDAADLPILADLLEQLGFADERVISHCRETHHGHTCWVFDRL